MSKVTLSNQRTFDVNPSETILEAALRQGLLLEYSCRTGRCGICRAVVDAGSTQVLQSESALTSDERERGWILTCSRSVQSDVSLDIEDLGCLGNIEIKTLPCRITGLDKITKDVMKVGLRLPPKTRLHFLAGQHIEIIYKDGIRRSYSIANASVPNSIIELHIRSVEDGVMSRYWFNHAELNDLLHLEGPRGTFFLRNLSDHNLVFLATGTGIAPVKAMLEELAVNRQKYFAKTLTVYWGGRSPDDIYWRPESTGIFMRFVPILSRPYATWEGRYGYVQDAMLDDGFDRTNTIVYACGSEAMTQSARRSLIAAGLPPKHFHADAFVSSKSTSPAEGG